MSRRVLSSTLTRRPIAQSNPASPAGAAYAALADEVLAAAERSSA
jgi:hypothetical protein